jgi:hypothetical protein
MRHTRTEQKPNGIASFEPVALGKLEAATWRAYYHKEWLRLLALSINLTHTAFNMPWPQTLYGSRLVAQALRAWSSHPADAQAAEYNMRRFYDVLARTHHLDIDPQQAAHLEVDWWRIHRHCASNSSDYDPISYGIAKTYSHVYQTPQPPLQAAAQERTEAMRINDQQGPTPEVTMHLVSSYRELHNAVN